MPPPRPVALNRNAWEEPGARLCHFCEWRLVVTEVDRKGDTIDAFDRHLQRHAEAMTVFDAEQAIFDSLVRHIESP